MARLGISGGACGADATVLYRGMDDTSFRNFDIIHSAGGINNQALLSESIGYSMYARKHVEGFSWLLYLY
jgi:hypothetical protein